MALVQDVIITSGGKNIAPYPIEDRIKSELPDFVSNCMVVSGGSSHGDGEDYPWCLQVGDKQKHLACLLTVKAVPDPLVSSPYSLLSTRSVLTAPLERLKKESNWYKLIALRLNEGKFCTSCSHILIKTSTQSMRILTAR